MIEIEQISPFNRTPEGAKESNSLVASSPKLEWQFVSQLQEVGGCRQREVNKTFASQTEAKKASKFRKMIRHLTNASIKQSESELQIHVDGVQIVKMAYLAVPPQCA